MVSFTILSLESTENYVKCCKCCPSSCLPSNNLSFSKAIFVAHLYYAIESFEKTAYYSDSQLFKQLFLQKFNSYTYINYTWIKYSIYWKTKQFLKVKISIRKTSTNWLIFLQNIDMKIFSLVFNKWTTNSKNSSHAIFS